MGTKLPLLKRAQKLLTERLAFNMITDDNKRFVDNGMEALISCLDEVKQKIVAKSVPCEVNLSCGKTAMSVRGNPDTTTTDTRHKSCAFQR